MKKILFIGLSAFLTYAAQAQENNQSIIFTGNTSRLVDHDTKNDIKVQLPEGFQKSVPYADKKTRAAARWYSHLAAVDTFQGGNGIVANNLSGVRIWHDSTVRQLFGNPATAGTVNYSSIYNVLDPQAPVFNDPNNYPGQMQVGPANVYGIDSIVVWGEYFRPKGGNPDTLIISVVKGSANQAINDILYYRVSPSSNATFYPDAITNGYITGIGADTVMIMPTIEADSIRSIGVNTNQTFVIKKVLTDADTSSFIKPYIFALPSTLMSDLDMPVGVTATFKSGNSWVANVDTISNLNNFIGIFSEESVGLAQPYRGNAPDFDLNVSGLMFSTSRAQYSPSFFIEIWNTVAVDKEIAWIDYHVTCPSCPVVPPLSVDDITSNITTSVTPNPASDNVEFTINLENAAKDVTISMTNLVGQQVKSVKVGAISANNAQSVNVSVSDLATGVYIYTIQADGDKISNKILVK